MFLCESHFYKYNIFLKKFNLNQCCNYAKKGPEFQAPLIFTLRYLVLKDVNFYIEDSEIVNEENSEIIYNESIEI